MNKKCTSAHNTNEQMSRRRSDWRKKERERENKREGGRGIEVEVKGEREGEGEKAKAKDEVQRFLAKTVMNGAVKR